MYVKVKVFAGAKKQTIKEIGENRYEIHVKEPAERNMANSRVISMVASLYNINPKAVKIFSGHHSPSKLLSIHKEE
ncbi:MAG: uncharacterized protein QG566_35 [Patescibacteria group bacterium]|jgi:uncharacterized protein YggU (UPF0235/DUF167 family)|nr:uncharacterized protein [Patescibacteria group bacterium]